ncbi:AAA family ATPase [Flavobacterium rhizosphaerae]|uniref:AAA family ATPase n=1 Tax=Flavobacterium rhizosphaerae TaxID=3163298 RepID=A0ABW8YZY2_9FLAO
MDSKLFKAAKIGNISLFRKGLEEEDINEKNELGNTPLMEAIKNGHVQLVKFILSRNPDTSPSLKNDDGYSVTDLAMQTSDPDMLALFNIDYKSSGGSGTSIYKKLLEDLVPIILNVLPVAKKLEENHFQYIIEDFTKIMLLATKGGEMKEIYKFSFGLVCTMIAPSDLNFESLSQIPETEAVKILIDIYNSQEEFFNKLKTYNYDFTLNSIDAVEDDDIALLKKSFYEFAEVVVKADGTVTQSEIENLKNINEKYFSLNKPYDNLKEGVKAIYTTDKNTLLREALSELNDLTGLDNIKQDIKSLINVINANKLRRQEGLPEFKSSMHAVFFGPPGTGKTTIARILSKIYSALGVLSGSAFVETDRSGLVAGYVGQTAIKTDKVIDQAINGLLFIDEAYTLSRSSSGNDYGQEAIDTILKRMEDNRDKLIVIVAGYENEMAQFINSNPGLKSRFSRYFYFRDYDATELTVIYKNMAKKAGFVLTESAVQKVSVLFSDLYDNRDKQFGNARLARNIFEKSFERHANRTAAIAPITREILTTLEEEDIPFKEYAINSENVL